MALITSDCAVVQETADQKDEMIKKLQQDVKGLQTAMQRQPTRAAANVKAGPVRAGSTIRAAGNAGGGAAAGAGDTVSVESLKKNFKSLFGQKSGGGKQQEKQAGAATGACGPSLQFGTLSCCCHPLTGVPCLRFGPRRGSCSEQSVVVRSQARNGAGPSRE